MSNYNIGTLTDTPVTHNGYSVTETDSNDVFQFNIGSTSNINLSLTNISTGDDADLTLYRDNGDGVFNSAVDQYVSGSARSSNVDDAINLADQSAGTYFAQVNRYAYGSSGDVTYDLALSTADPSNLLPIETQDGNVTSNPTFSGQVGNTNTSDVYGFSLGYFGAVDINLTGLSSDADIRLIADSNGNRIVDSGEVLLSSTAGGSSSESIHLDDAGNYFLQVYQFTGDTNYNLAFNYSSTPNTLALTT